MNAARKFMRQIPEARRKLVKRTILATLVGVVALGGLGGLAFMYTGLYYIAATEPHIPPVRWLLTTGRTRSVELHSRNVQAPDLGEAALIRSGIGIYERHCEVCHGAPGVARQQIGLGIRPTPPPLMTATVNWTDPQIYWIVTHGLKMSGMPGFAVRLDERERWATVAFLRRLPTLTPTEYQRWSALVRQGDEGQAEGWLAGDDLELSRLEAEGDPELGKARLQEYGCPACHSIPGMGTTGRVGPPLTRLAERYYIAGSLVNAPRQLMAWIQAPEAFRPDTAMPNLGVEPKDALQMAAYLYQFGSPKRLLALQANRETDR
jgi:mono/diheme cytochrome c family protein